MTFPVPGGVITARYDQLRPLHAEVKTHIHGAIDIAADTGTEILAPETGMVYYFAAFRPDRSRTMDELELDDQPFDFGAQPYFYDIYGAITVLVGRSGITHLFCHSFLNQLFNDPPQRVQWRYKESPKLERWPLTAFFTTNGHGRHAYEGREIAAVGNAGYSTGPHVHYEMHHGRFWQPHNKRPNPADYFEEA
jgi:hypothetical protein